MLYIFSNDKAKTMTELASVVFEKLDDSIYYVKKDRFECFQQNNYVDSSDVIEWLNSDSKVCVLSSTTFTNFKA